MTRKIILVTIVVLLLGVSTASIRIQDAKAAITVNITLYGSAINGWGSSAANITSPGPTIAIDQYDYLNLTLYSQDGLPHQFYVDYNNNGHIDTGEPASTTFSSNTVFGFNATISGTFTYRCSIHPNIMYGTLIVQPAGPEFSPSLILPLFIVATIVAAVAYGTKHSTKKMLNMS
jgi:plastocyanin